MSPCCVFAYQRVAYVGEVHFANGEHVGVELEEAVGTCDGMVEGKRFFTCEPKVRGGVSIISTPIFTRRALPGRVLRQIEV